jgi:hypothetical protein
MSERKNILKNALINSFVDDYKSYRDIVDAINKNLTELNIDYQYTYDEFCTDFLDETLKNIDKMDLSKINQNNFFVNFWKFNIYNIQSMLNNKIENLKNNKKT